MRRLVVRSAALLAALVSSVVVAPTGETETGRLALADSERGTLEANAAGSTDPLAPQWLVGSFPEARFGHSVGTAGDVNGDGFADVIIGVRLYDSLRGRAQLHLGSATGFNATPDWAVDGLTGDDQYGYSVGTAGDVNGDGFDDFLVGAPFDTSTGHAYLYLGSAGVPDTVPDWTATGDTPAGWFGLSVATAGDVNGDGFDDVIVGAPRSYYQGEFLGQAKVFLGNSSGLSEVAAWSRYGTQNYSDFGTSVGTAGDVNGDGFDEVIVGAPMYDGADNDSGRVEIYSGTPFGPQFTPSWWAEAPYRQRFGYTVGTAGDVNDDGYADVMAGGYYYSPFVSVFHGSPSGPSWTADWTDYVELRSVGTAGDVNGDGYDDVIVGSPSHDDPAGVTTGAAFVYLGGTSGLEADPSVTMLGKPGSGFGDSVGAAGDVNADGLDDVVAGAPWYESEIGEVGAAYVRFGPLDCEDADEDSLCPPQDCDDTNPYCGEDCTDDDGDGHCVGFDCDEANPNCTADCTDGDGDLYCLGIDCDDTVSSCTEDCSDLDGDGLRGCADDCDDTNAFCGLDCTDADGDGHCVGSDCDEANPNCTIDCTDGDADGLCPPFDCDDATADCTTDCGDADLDFARDCDVDCDTTNPNCRFDCTDDDGDGYCAETDCNDQDPYCAARCDGPNIDGDPILDYCDNCIRVANPDQADGDQDGAGDACDVCPDDPNYGVAELEELSWFLPPAALTRLGVGPSGNVYLGTRTFCDAFTPDGSYLDRIAIDPTIEYPLKDFTVGPNELLYFAQLYSGGPGMDSGAYDTTGQFVMPFQYGNRVALGDNGSIFTLYYFYLPDAESFWEVHSYNPITGAYAFTTGWTQDRDLTRSICVNHEGFAYTPLIGWASIDPEIRVYDPELNQVATIALDSEFDPLECGFDSHDFLYVADASEARIRVFDRSGEFVTDLDVALGGLQIVDFAIGPDDRLYLLYDNSRVSIYGLPIEDWDRDTVEFCDNCPDTANAQQSDLDLDGEGDACDLDDGVIYMMFQQTSRVDWQAEQAYDSWNCYRGDLAELRAGGDYTQAPGSNPLALRECGLVETWIEDTPGLDPDETAFYLTTGMAGGVEGDLGEDGSGQTRPNANACP